MTGNYGEPWLPMSTREQIYKEEKALIDYKSKKRTIQNWLYMELVTQTDKF